jgi:hypothetical protein
VVTLDSRLGGKLHSKSLSEFDDTGSAEMTLTRVIAIPFLPSEIHSQE